MEKIDLNNKKILVTGNAGFIGCHLVLRLLKEIERSVIVGIDNVNDYYDTSLKEYRLKLQKEKAMESSSEYHFVRGNIADKEIIEKLFSEYHFDVVVNLAAQAGVRYSIDHPDIYIESNIIGFYNILEACRHYPVEHLVYASSSSVYGGNKKVPFSTEDKVDHPVSLYAATKKSNELLAHSYSKLYNIPSTGLRFFTVYGPAGRPDMFYFSATQKLVRGESIQIFNYGNCKRDFTYIDDIVEGVYRVMQKAPQKKNGEDGEKEETEEKCSAALLALLMKLKKGDAVNAEEYEIKEGETSPPKRYTSGSIILTMENAGQFIEDEELRAQIKGSGIGTSATRAEILKKLVKIEYLSLNKKTQVLTPTLMGEMIYDVVDSAIKPLLNPALTASWEKGLTQVADGTISSDEYMVKLKDFVVRRTNYVKQMNNQGNLYTQFRTAEANYKKSH